MDLTFFTSEEPVHKGPSSLHEVLIYDENLLLLFSDKETSLRCSKTSGFKPDGQGLI